MKHKPPIEIFIFKRYISVVDVVIIIFVVVVVIINIICVGLF